MRAFTKEFKVVALSDNTNSFGLCNVVMVAKDGEAWQAGANHISVPKKDDIIKLVFTEVSEGVMGEYPQFPSGFEIPARMPDPPAELLKEFFPEG